MDRDRNFKLNWDHETLRHRGAAMVRVGGKWYSAGFGPLKAKTWYYLTASYDGETLRAYLNGKLVTENTEPSGSPDEEDAWMKMGRHAGQLQYWEGSIRQVRIYNRPLPAEEILDLAISNGVVKRRKAPSAGPKNTDSQNAGDSTIEPLSHWLLDDQSKRLARDSAGGKHGTIKGLVRLFEYGSHRGINFEANGTHIRTPFKQHLPIWTVSVMARGKVEPLNGPSAGPVNRGQNFQFVWAHPNPAMRGVVMMKIGRRWHFSTFGKLLGQHWYHLTASYDGKTLKVYVDGAKVSENKTPSGPANKDDLSLLIAGSGVQGSNHWNGSAMDVRVYDIVLTDRQIAALALPYKNANTQSQVRLVQKKIRATTPAQIAELQSTFKNTANLMQELAKVLTGVKNQTAAAAAADQLQSKVPELKTLLDQLDRYQLTSFREHILHELGRQITQDLIRLEQLPEVQRLISKHTVPLAAYLQINRLYTTEPMDQTSAGGRLRTEYLGEESFRGVLKKSKSLLKLSKRIINSKTYLANGRDFFHAVYGLHKQVVQLPNVQPEYAVEWEEKLGLQIADAELELIPELQRISRYPAPYVQLSKKLPALIADLSRDRARHLKSSRTSGAIKTVTVGGVSWPVPTQWIEGQKAPPIPMASYCQFSRTQRFGRDLALIGVGFGPSAEDRVDPIYTQYKKEILEAMIKSLPPGKTTSTSSPKIKGVEYDQILGDIKLQTAIVELTVQDGYCVSYWFVGPKEQAVEFMKLVGSAKNEDIYIQMIEAITSIHAVVKIIENPDAAEQRVDKLKKDIIQIKKLNKKRKALTASLQETLNKKYQVKFATLGAVHIVLMQRLANKPGVAKFFQLPMIELNGIIKELSGQ